ncbi:hypothetical protein BKA67DRAFT_556879 [Truncatella angustata]|uniref:Uncharacterized protein n=1 Tax=Truncatella angustata TaxID=152316 RepID=A0A9P8US29_9PEZI|nr:uncharacterized protein BKA67DRAFT_556879 [Truncatella angustata]KAH6657985.1 hypothetical protein BKA67DRAFT_556879 [Truncatella angustata]KAH8195197.1 hypothetical protein TruAng_010640 [Truncatella angustata]
MFKNIATWALLAAALVQAAPATFDVDTELEIRDLELEAVLKRDLEPFELETRGVELEDRDIELDDRDIETRASRTLSGLANFDAKVANSVPTKELGIYGGLFWQGFGLVRKDSTLTGVRPFSAPNVAVYGPITRLTNNARAVVTTQYSGSIAANFTLSQFYYGCSTTTVLSTLALPTRCNVAAAGYNRAGKLLAYQLFPEYTPGVGLSANLVLGIFTNKFVGLDHVIFASTYSIGPLLGATVIDDVKYTLKTIS